MDEIDEAQAVFDRDQNDAEIRNITDLVVNHFIKLHYGAKMSEESAVLLTRDFQKFLMTGVSESDALFVIGGVSE